jgi:hypothetical protein
MHIYLLLPLLLILISFPLADGHLPRLAHYNGGSQLSNGYLIMMATEPEYIKPGEQVQLMISIQDTFGKDLNAVKTMIKVFKDDELIKEFPLAVHPTGDFREFYTFQEAGIYHVKIETFGAKELPYSEGPPAGSALFNIFVSQWAGQIFNGVITAAIIIPIAVLGTVLAARTRTMRRTGPLERDTVVQYIAVLCAITAGILHTFLFGDHSAETIFYGVFFIIAGFAQLSYGVLFMMFKRKLLNYIGLAGTMGIIGLYVYSIILPPPLHSTPLPEHAEIIGISVKIIESVMLIALIYTIRRDRMKVQVSAG